MAGSLTRGLATLIINQTESQDIFTASDSGTTRFTLAEDGSITQTSADTSGTAYSLLADSLTDGIGMDISGDALTTGQLLNITSTSTALTTGSLGVFDWSPSSWATASGDLVQIDLGQYGDVTGDLFSIEDNGSDIFTVDTAQIESAVPHLFSAAGDVSFSYDIIMTNQTASKIESYGPFTIEVGESFENNDLTFTTYGTGDVVVNPSGTGELVVSAADPTLILDTTTATDTDFWFGVVEDASNDDNDYLRIGDGTTPGSNVFVTIDTNGLVGVGNLTPSGLLDVDGTVTGQALVQINDSDSDQDLLVASSSGTTRFRIANTGELIFGDDGSSNFGTLDLATLASNRTYTFPDSAGTVCLTSGNCVGTTSFWQANAGALSPVSLTYDVNLGDAATSSAKISMAGSLTRGLATLIINQTESQDVFTASASGSTLLTLDNSGNLGIGTDPSTVLHVYDSDTSSNVLTTLRLDRIDSDSIGAANLGTAIDFYLEDAGSNLEQAAALDVVWTTATDGSEDSELRLSVSDTGNFTENFRFWANNGSGTVPVITTSQASGAYAFNTGTGDTYIANGQAFELWHNGANGLLFQNAASGTAGNSISYYEGLRYQIPDPAANASTEVFSFSKSFLSLEQLKKRIQEHTLV
jgi:hypothetical protein